MRHLSFYPQSLQRGCRSEQALKLAIAEMYVTGVSTRKVSRITEQLCGTEISATQVSRIAKLLDQELEQFRQRELGQYPVVYLDAHYEKVRVQGTVQDLAILKAIGVNRWGKPQVLGVRTGHRGNTLGRFRANGPRLAGAVRPPVWGGLPTGLL